MERFVVGTGRCGSTLLSSMLACHPQALVLSECIGALDRLDHLKPGTVSRDAFRALLLRSNPFVDMSLRRAAADSEALLDTEAMRDANPPALLIAALPFLGERPDVLFAELLAEIDAYPEQSMHAHYTRLFAWLQSKLGRAFWIERSGESAVYLPQLFETFPRARYVHIHRRGAEAVLSMAKHSYLSLVTTFFATPATRAELEQTEYGGAPVTRDDPISRRFAERPALTDYAAYWNYQILMAYRAFARMSPAQLLQVRFEDLIADPRATLSTIAAFFELPDAPDWMARAAKMIDPAAIRSSTAELDATARERLDQACMSGELLLGRRTHPWVFPTLALVRELEQEHRRHLP